jgi:peptidoglycan/LPS O-acetylase OafA/YrhL
MRSAASTSQTYMPQLDALRFFAVLGVMIHHNWAPKNLPWLLGDLSFGALGVRLFFVLSGFLITGILLDCRNTAEAEGAPPMFFLRQFYARRFLRIFPIYYLTVILALLADVPDARQIWGWLITYSTNIYITMTNEWVGRVGHFWTLAVEEQFYLLWPWIILFVPRKRLVPVLLFFISLGPIYRAFAYKMYPFNIWEGDFKAATFTLGSLDSLVIGALLALLWNSDIPKPALQRYLTRLVLPIGLFLFTTCLLLYHYNIKPSLIFIVGDFATALIFAWLVSSAGIGFRGVSGRLLEFPVLAYLGKITYGIYVYHNLAPLMLVPVFESIGILLQVPSLSNFVWSSLLTILIAMLSWHFIELPINKLKRYFEYHSSKPPAILIDSKLPVGGE